MLFFSLKLNPPHLPLFYPEICRMVRVPIKSSQRSETLFSIFLAYKGFIDAATRE